MKGFKFCIGFWRRIKKKKVQNAAVRNEDDCTF